MEKHKGKHVSLEDTKEINFLFNKWSRGDQQAEAELIQVLYPYIHEIAHYQFKTKAEAGLQTTEIVNEAFIKLNKYSGIGVNRFSNNKVIFLFCKYQTIHDEKFNCNDVL